MSLKTFFQGLVSLRLTVACLLAAVVLVFAGTLAQVDMGLYQAQNAFFRSVLVYWQPKGSTMRIPVFPGGYLVGGVLMANLLGAYFKYFKFTRKKAGIIMVHTGIVVLLLGQFATDFLQEESYIKFREGDARNYSESGRLGELVFVNHTNADFDEVISIPEARLARSSVIKDERLPFTINVKKFFPNSRISPRAPMVDTEPPAATEGEGKRFKLVSVPRTTSMDLRDVPSAVIELNTPSGSLGSWLVSEYLDDQTVLIGSTSYQMIFRPVRRYVPFYLHLQKFSHDKYMGTEIPKNFSSRVRIQHPGTGEDRDVLIYMNNPLRYAGATYFQAGFDEHDPKVTILQVVRNPSWLTPYLSCVLVAVGMTTQFMTHLLGFTRKKRASAPAPTK